jgi:UPF0271 protein
MPATIDDHRRASRRRGRRDVPRIDFNCDLGEGCGDDAAIVPHISSASIACGGHAGDDTTMRATLRLCRVHGVVAGARPGYEERGHFGRRELALSPDAIAALVHAQVGRLATIAADEGVRLAHVKPHGALYNLAARDRTTADAIAAAVAALDASLVLFGLSGSALTDAGTGAGLRVAHEVFAERGYGRDGHLLARGLPGAEIESIDAAIAQACALATTGTVTSVDGQRLRVRADTLCLHGDRADAALFAQQLRHALTVAGVEIFPVGVAA